MNALNSLNGFQFNNHNGLDNHVDPIADSDVVDWDEGWQEGGQV